MPYKVKWKCGWKSHVLDQIWEDKAKVKSYATNYLRSHYLDEVTILAEMPDGRYSPILTRRCVRKNEKPFYGEWEYC